MLKSGGSNQLYLRRSHFWSMIGIVGPQFTHLVKNR